MRIEDAGLKTGWLAAVAGWAVAAWLLALAGMGGRVDPLPDDPTLLKPLPALPAVRADRVEPLNAYDQFAGRPVFSADRRPHPFFLQGEGEEETDSPFDFVLTSVLITPSVQLAILQPADGSQPVRVRLDEAPDSHPAWQLVALGARSAVFEGPEGRRELPLRVYDGMGGQLPTPVSSPDPDAAATASGPAPAPPPGQPRAAMPVATPEADAAPPAAASPPARSQRNDGVPVPPAGQADAPMTDQAQMDAIRQRIQARREQLRRQNANPPPPKPVE
ncbi:hypothetical protein [Lysobacter sp. A3-1-A15]|uniref:hypothetical protein n=1 Tax=Novilysobacter viscosus TaxID=3098602 RepID=UPI002ED8A10A